MALLAITAGVAVVLCGLIAAAVRWQRAKSWPTTGVTVVSGLVTPYGENYLLSVSFYYTVAESIYGGTHTETFAREDDANAALEELLNGQYVVRYDAAKPDRSSALRKAAG